MYRKLYVFPLLIIAIILVLNTGCSIKNSDNNKIAYISSNADSEYENTFKELQLGILFDFDLRLPNADKSWVDIWVEGYSNGKAVEPFPLTQLSYGLSPKKVEEGKMGFGIINPNSKETQFFLYSSGVRTSPHSIDNNFFAESAISS
ncbi:c-di-AMP phosphodiesterase-like protein [Anaerosolibacter carboniphilus]|uniref:C-di-AMP phosphodiesterase-like protein n=1 Tax=Anaerosolibacter carboniphilus TaxID=1417629 RepID=A0A841KWE2_9FIRM|nr:hypothetical protein [Anaerosolibacter carboniphilus]MBB6217761.1 c-di-AMP phosphodiesterase-like protein [Anaerosolibacter carboniphilus]